MTDAPLSPLEDACTVILLRDGAAGLQTLMLERTSSSRAFAGAWVFPGGKVDPEDYRPVEQGGLRVQKKHHGTPVISSASAAPELSLDAARRAGIREALEETGQSIRPDSMVPLSMWIPLQQIPRRFRTWFFLAPAQEGTIELSPAEHGNFAWLSPREVLDRHAQGLMKLVIPTWLTLYQLRDFDSVAAALDAVHTAGPQAFNSKVLPLEANLDQSIPTTTVMWEGDEAYPPLNGDAWAPPGSRHRVSVNVLPWTFEQRN